MGEKVCFFEAFNNGLVLILTAAMLIQFTAFSTEMDFCKITSTTCIFHPSNYCLKLLSSVVTFQSVDHTLIYRLGDACGVGRESSQSYVRQLDVWVPSSIVKE